ncbi:MAG: hypothetical protein AAGH78_12925 [Cyanobacteria bacterium P01_H01_bin.58]
MLCLPIFNPDGELIGVTQLVNKLRSPASNKTTSSARRQQPESFYGSFDDSDRKCLHIFNNQAGVILQNAELLATVQQQEKTLQNALVGDA